MDLSLGVEWSPRAILFFVTDPFRFMGGRMKPGDTPRQSLVRLMKRELSIDIPPHRFRPLGVHSYAWARRQQDPMDNGTCDISLVFTLVLDAKVVESIKRDPKEYSEMG